MRKDNEIMGIKGCDEKMIMRCLRGFAGLYVKHKGGLARAMNDSIYLRI